jgi:hypothetical protein
VYEYEFKGNFLEKNGLLPALTQLGTGNFGNYSLCGTTRPAYNFDYNSGFYFDNNAAAPGGFITNTSGQTIELYMKFQNVSTWRRIIDYKNRTSDRGVYAYGLAFQFYNFVTGGTSIFNANAWVYVAVTRSAAKVYNLYLAGTTTPLATFNDTGDDGIPNASGRISFFQDDLAVGGEASAGSIALLRIHNRELSGVEIRDNANDTCSFILSPDWLAFFAKRKNQNVQLDWTVNWGEEGGVFEIIRSENGKDFLTVGYVDSQKMQNTYSFEDKNAPQTDLYYQVRLRKQGTEIFATRAVFLPLHAESEIDLKVSPNPVSGQSSLQIDFNHSEKEITAWELADLAGQILQRGEFAAERGANRFYIDAPKVSGCFFLSLKTSVGIFRKKIISERK